NRKKPDGEKKTPAAAEQRPTGRPDAFDDRTNPGPVQQRAQDQPRDSADDQKPYFVPRGAVTAKNSARNEAKDHRCQRRNEAQSRVTTAIEEKRFVARKQIEEPCVKGPGEIAVLVPMRGKPTEDARPWIGCADCRIIEIGARQWI